MAQKWPGWNQKILMKATVFDGYSAPETGYNGCLFAYGQTGSGKTFTMQGVRFAVFLHSDADRWSTTEWTYINYESINFPCEAGFQPLM